MKDFFISYTNADRQWAEWIAWQLEEADFTVIIQAWDFRPGADFVSEMDRAAREAKTTIAVLSPAYFKSRFTQAEWSVAFAKGNLLPVRIAEFDVEGLLSVRVYIDLVKREEAQAKEVLLAGINSERAKPKTAPGFPGSAKPERNIADKPPFPAALPPVWNVPRPPNPHFIGRDKLLEEMRQTLLKGQAAALVALHGLGGIGKTQLAAEYAHARHADYQVVWWLRAETETTLAEDLVALARALELPEHEAREVPVIVAAVLRWLNGRTDWLLVFDNADNPTVVRAYLPQNRQGHVLITSRDPNWRGLATPLEVETLDEDAAAQFLLERTGRGGKSAEAAAKELANELGGLPLALEQAGAYCEATGKPLADYLRLFRLQQRELLQRGQPANYPATVATTWEISFQAAEAVAPAAAELLNLCAFLAPEELPLDMLRQGVEHLTEILAAAVRDELTLDDVLAALRRYSLLNRMDDSVVLHRLVQWGARNRLPETQQRRWAEAALRVVNAAFPEDSDDDVRTWDICARILPHANAVMVFADIWQLAPEAAARLVNEIGVYFWSRAQYTEARQSLERALQLDEVAFGPDHPNVARDVNNLGSALQDLGDLAGALQCYKRALRLDEAIFGHEHPNVATSANNLSNVLQDLGDYAAARQYAERALYIDEVAFGPDHPEVATDLNNLGRILQGIGDLAGARHYCERALHIDEAAFGSDHLNVARDLNNLGSVLQDLGDLEDARRQFERALGIFITSIGEDHPKTFITRKNLAALG